MAKRRMFSLDIIDTDYFLEMPATTQLLYFQLSLRADDDGFVSSPKRIIRLLGSSEDDLKILFSKQYIIPFQSGICVIVHWKIHNFIRKDRYTETIYSSEKLMIQEDINGVYSLVTKRLPNDNQMVTEMVPQERIAKVSLDKVIIYKNRTKENDMTTEFPISKTPNSGESPLESLIPDSFPEKKGAIGKSNIEIIVENYHEFCPSLGKVRKITKDREKAILQLLKEYSIEEISEAMEKVEESDFLTGRTNQQWKANFDWIIKPGNLNKILEGNYDNKQNANSSSRYEPEYKSVYSRDR